MLAYRLHKQAPINASSLTREEIADPEPQAAQILTKVLACGACHTDLHIVEGELSLHKKPIIPGHQVVGEVVGLSEGASRFEVGERVGLAWLAHTCGRCRFCISGRENLCQNALFTGYDIDGGFAQFVVAYEEFAYRIPQGFEPAEISPLLCGGIIGYRALRISGIKPGGRLGLYGFGNSAHIAIQVAVHWGCEVYVFSRTDAHRKLAGELGAVWTGKAEEAKPGMLDSAIIFAPAGELIPPAMEALDKGGKLVLAGIYMSPTPPLDYEKHLYYEKSIQSVANSERRDGEELLALAEEIPIKTEVEEYPLAEVNEVLMRLKEGKVQGGAVLMVSE